MTDVKLNSWDILVVCLYFVMVLATGLFSMCRSNRGTVSGYFLAGRFMFWLPVGASVFASNIGSEHFIGLAGSGAAAGIGVGAFEINALIILQFTGWIFLPVFLASRVCTLPEFMSKRFGGQRIRTFLAVLSLILYIFTKISVNLYSGAVFIQQALKWNLYLSVFLILLMTSICTVSGGLAAVIYTDTLQFFIMLIGAGIVAARAFVEVGGYQALQFKYMQAVPSIMKENVTCGLPKENSLQMLRAINDPELPWLGFVLGQTPASVWYWCADQMMVQRLLAAKSLSHAQGATIFAGFMKVFPLFFIVLPGMISRVLFTDQVACVTAEECYKYCENDVGCSNIAYPLLVLELMPSGLRGLMMAVMLAALMSDLTSIFNSASTLFTIDIWPQVRKKASVKELMIVGRSFVIFMVAVSIAWIPVIQNMQSGQLFIYIQAVSANLAPPVASVYVCAILWKRMNENGAFWGLITGFLTGLIRLVLDSVYSEPSCGEEDTRPVILSGLHYMYFALILFWLTALVAVLVSVWTEPPEDFRIIRTTYWTRFDSNPRKDDLENLELKRAENLKEKTEKEHTEDADQEVQQKNKEKTILSYVTNFYNWFCGFDHSAKGEEKELELYKHLKDVASLKQGFWEKITLNFFLACIVGFAVFICGFFSVPTVIQ
ncbi:sodium/glucose cotransporter 5-like isoform X2 [Limulus polyphemus]|uniref:Sodium/glucose cotransporter 5-like isoform X2 n=1 Tax=Limulus polyphemus TaxID=6850 RepID=A0ABM1SBN1_LIMPO|nr:sodium/glucose cotransporter 5-like isoform X2 [Limulus polyphemus]